VLDVPDPNRSMQRGVILKIGPYHKDRGTIDKDAERNGRFVGSQELNDGLSRAQLPTKGMRAVFDL
jgi:hypothetical protein